MSNLKNLIVISLTVLALVNIVLLPICAVDTLGPSDFQLESFEKTIDFLDYARTYAVTHGLPKPADNSHAYVYLTYVNLEGMQMMYAGVVNMTDGIHTVTLPIQSWMMHYKSENGSKDIVTAGAFMMLLAFKDENDTLYDDSPDRNDTLYASFNIGFDLTTKFGAETPPGLSSTATIIPLTHTADKLHWSWGLKYTNLTAIWWKTSFDPEHPERLFIAVSRYDELTFTYDLVLNPDEGTATLTANYVVGKMTDLWVFSFGIFGLIFPELLSVHYNSTGCYRLNGRQKVSNETVYQFIENQAIKMSIVQFQSTVILNHTVYSESDGTNVTDSEVDVGDSNITTSAEDGEKIFEASFGTKKTYNLYNYTADPTETVFETYNTTTRTAKPGGFTDTVLFHLHTGLMKYIPLILAHIDSELYEAAINHLLDFTYSDYFYIVAYPTYSGYRIEHDPTYTAYYDAEAQLTATPPFPTGIIIVAVIAIVGAATAAVLIRRRSTKHAPPPPPPVNTGQTTRAH